MSMFNESGFNESLFNEGGTPAEFVCETLACEASGPDLEMLAEMVGGVTHAATAWMTARPHHHRAAEFAVRPLEAVAPPLGSAGSDASNP